MSVFLSLIVIVAILVVVSKPVKKRSVSGRTVIPINSPRDGKFLRKLEARARRDFPGRTEQWYRKKADTDFRQHRKR